MKLRIAYSLFVLTISGLSIAGAAFYTPAPLPSRLVPESSFVKQRWNQKMLGHNNPLEVISELNLEAAGIWDEMMECRGHGQCSADDRSCWQKVADRVREDYFLENKQYCENENASEKIERRMTELKIQIANLSVTSGELITNARAYRDVTGLLAFEHPLFVQLIIDPIIEKATLSPEGRIQWPKEWSPDEMILFRKSLEVLLLISKDQCGAWGLLPKMNVEIIRAFISGVSPAQAFIDHARGVRDRRKSSFLTKLALQVFAVVITKQDVDYFRESEFLTQI